MKVPWPISYGQIRMPKRKTLQYHPGQDEFLPQQGQQCGRLGSTNSTAPLLLLFSHVLNADTPFMASCWCSEALDTPLVQASSTNFSRRTTCRTSSVHTNSAWKVTRPSLTSTSPPYGLHPIIVIVVVTRRVSSRWDQPEVCTLMCLKPRRRMSGTDRVNRQPRVPVARWVILYGFWGNVVILPSTTRSC